MLSNQAHDSDFASHAYKIAGIVIPCYNESQRISIDSFHEYILDNPDFLFCFVNDGSTDDTLNALNGLYIKNPKNVMLVDLVVNVGKGEAVRQGMLHLHNCSKCEFYCFIDADLSAPLFELSRLVEISRNSELSLTFGSRVAVYGANIKRLALRHYFGRVFATAASIILEEVIYDTQCGLKVIKSDFIIPLFGVPFLTKWLFDLEIFARLISYSRGQDLEISMKEVPLNEWIEKGGSRITLKDLFLVPVALCKISQFYSRKIKPTHMHRTLNYTNLRS